MRRIAIVQDSIEFARQINSDQGRTTSEAARRISEYMGWAAPLVVRDEEAGPLLSDEGLSEVSCLVLPSNSLRHADSPLRGVFDRKARPLERAVNDGMGLVMLHHFIPELPNWPIFSGLSLRQVTTEQMSEVEWLRDYTAAAPNPLLGRAIEHKISETAGPYAWRALDVDHEGRWRTLITRSARDGALAVRSTRSNGTVIVSTLPLDWWGYSAAIENWILAAAMGRPTALQLAGSVLAVPPLPPWRLTKEQIAWLTDKTPKDTSMQFLEDVRPADLVFTDGAIAADGVAALIQKGFRAIAVAPAESSASLAFDVSESNRLTRLGDDLARMLSSHSQDTDVLLANPSAQLFPLRDLLGAIAVTNGASREMREAQRQLLGTSRLKRMLALLPFDGMTLSSVLCAIQILYLVRRLTQEDSEPLGIDNCAVALERHIPTHSQFEATCVGARNLLTALKHKPKEIGEDPPLDPGNSQAGPMSNSERSRLGETYNVARWCSAIGTEPVFAPAEEAVPPATAETPTSLLTASAVELLGYSLSIAVEWHREPKREREETWPGDQPMQLVQALELSHANATSLNGKCTTAFALGWVYSHGAPLPWVRPQLHSAPVPAGNDLSRIRQLELHISKDRRLTTLGRWAAWTIALVMTFAGVGLSALLAVRSLTPPWLAIIVGVAMLVVAVETLSFVSLLPTRLEGPRAWLRETLRVRARESG